MHNSEHGRLLRRLDSLEAQVSGLQRRPASFSPGPSTAACDTIRFTIIGGGALLATGDAWVEAAVDAVPNGFTANDVLGYAFGEVVVYDPSGCFFNEPFAQLTGRKGWAHLMVPAGEGYNNDPLNPYNVPQWEVFSLCCADVGCS